MASTAAYLPSLTDRHASYGSLERTPSLPPYSEHASGGSDDGIELASLNRTESTTSEASSSGPPSSSAFHATIHLQVQTPGKPLFSLPMPIRPDPIPVFALAPEPGTGRLRTDRPLYLSLRPSRRSGSCTLVHADDPAQAPISTTTFRFGPGRPPVVRLTPDGRPDAADGESAEEQQQQQCEVVRPRVWSRATRFAVPRLGEFAWRYGSRAERAAEGADCLLVLEELLQEEGEDDEGSSSSSSNRVDTTKKSKKKDQQRRKVAQLVRNETYRTPGTARCTAGNGGRLMLDLRAFDEKVRDQVQVLAVTTVLVMLKKEVDRRRGQQMAMMSGGGGGP